MLICSYSIIYSSTLIHNTLIHTPLYLGTSLPTGGAANVTTPIRPRLALQDMFTPPSDLSHPNRPPPPPSILSSISKDKDMEEGNMKQSSSSVKSLAIKASPVPLAYNDSTSTNTPSKNAVGGTYLQPPSPPLSSSPKSLQPPPSQGMGTFATTLPTALKPHRQHQQQQHGSTITSPSAAAGTARTTATSPFRGTNKGLVNGNGNGSTSGTVAGGSHGATGSLMDRMRAPFRVSFSSDRSATVGILSHTLSPGNNLPIEAHLGSTVDERGLEIQGLEIPPSQRKMDPWDEFFRPEYLIIDLALVVGKQTHSSLCRQCQFTLCTIFHLFLIDLCPIVTWSYHLHPSYIAASPFAD